MKVSCPYCDSYVETGETATCPLCGAPLGGAVKAAEEQEKAAQAEAEAKAAEAAETQAKEQTKQTLITAAAGLFGSAAGSLFRRSSADDRPLPPPEGGRSSHGPNHRGPGGSSGHGPGAGKRF